MTTYIGQASCDERGKYVGGQAEKTGNEVSRFKASDLVSVFTSADYVVSTAKWQVGDILVSNTHTVIVISGASAAGSYKVVCSKLNVRSAPSTKNEPVATYVRGEVINSIAADTVTDEGYVWAHYVGRSGSTRYVAIGTADGSEKYLVKC